MKIKTLFCLLVFTLCGLSSATENKTNTVKPVTYPTYHTVDIWMLAAITNWSSNPGQFTVIERFSSKHDCEALKQQIVNSPVGTIENYKADNPSNGLHLIEQWRNVTRYRCLSAKVLRP